MCRFHSTSIKQEISESESNQVVEWKCTSVTQETQPIVENNVQSKTEPLRVEAVIINLWNNSNGVSVNHLAFSSPQ